MSAQDQPQDMSSLAGRMINFGKFNVTSQVFHKTSHSFALVNLKPLLPGHILVCPLAVKPHLSDLTKDEVADLFLTVTRVQRTLKRVYRAEAFNVAVQDGEAAGQSVPHVHCHVIPRVTGDPGGGDKVHEWLEGEEGNVGRHQQEQQQQQQERQAGQWAKDEERKPRSMEEMEKEARWLREEMEKDEKESMLATPRTIDLGRNLRLVNMYLALNIVAALAAVAASPLTARDNIEHLTSIVSEETTQPSTDECQRWRLTKDTTDSTASPACSLWSPRPNGKSESYTLRTVKLTTDQSCTAWHIEVNDGIVAPVCGKVEANTHHTHTHSHEDPDSSLEERSAETDLDENSPYHHHYHHTSPRAINQGTVDIYHRMHMYTSDLGKGITQWHTRELSNQLDNIDYRGTQILQLVQGLLKGTLRTSETIQLIHRELTTLGEQLGFQDVVSAALEQKGDPAKPPGAASSAPTPPQPSKPLDQMTPEEADAFVDQELEHAGRVFADKLKQTADFYVALGTHVQSALKDLHDAGEAGTMVRPAFDAAVKQYEATQKESKRLLRDTLALFWSEEDRFHDQKAAKPKPKPEGGGGRKSPGTKPTKKKDPVVHQSALHEAVGNFLKAGRRLMPWHWGD
ncbi:hypothetical protein KC347_g1043 [Hortaea werneckii]|nr:hypothetical protein KC347_g1043 [Hortaea werneckii]